MQTLQIKSFSEYCELAAVTNDTSNKTHLENNAHYIFGIWTELQEFKDATDVVNRDEEVGDIFWYLSQYIISNKLLHLVDVIDYYWEVPSFSQDRCLYTIGRKISSPLSKITDIEKKCLAYGKDRDKDKLELHFKEIIEQLYYSTNKSFKQICEANIYKLRVRYGDKFDAHLALNRNLGIERSNLEENLS